MTTWDWDFVREVTPTLLKSLWPTFLITVFGFGIAVVLGCLLVIARVNRARPVRYSANGLADLIRSTPFLVLLFLIFYALPQIGIVLSPFVAGVVTLGIYYTGYASDTLLASMRAIPPALIEASAVLGMPNGHTWRRVIIPLAARASVPGLTSYLIMCFKETALLVAIGVPVLLGKAQSIGYFNFRYLEVYTIVGLIYLVITYPAAWLLRRIEAKNVFE